MLFQKEIKHKTGTAGGKVIKILSNTIAQIIVLVNGKRYTIQTAGKTPQQLGDEIRKL